MEYVEIVRWGANAGTSPHTLVWPEEVVFDLFLAGLVAGLLIATGVLLQREVRRLGNGEHGGASFVGAFVVTSLASLAFLATGLTFLWLDLSRGWNAFRIYLTLRPTSPMSWGSWILLITSMHLAWTAWQGKKYGLLRFQLRWPFVQGRGQVKISTPVLKRFLWLGRIHMALGIMLGCYTGLLLSTMVARPLWNNPVLPVLFLVSGLNSGIAALLLSVRTDHIRTLLVKPGFWLVLAEGGIFSLYLIGLASSGASAQAALTLLVDGSYKAAFWGVVVGAGLILPLVILLTTVHRDVNVRWIAVVSTLTLVRALALRWILIFAGQTTTL